MFQHTPTRLADTRVTDLRRFTSGVFSCTDDRSYNVTCGICDLLLRGTHLQNSGPTVIHCLCKGTISLRCLGIQNHSCTVGPCKARIHNLFRRNTNCVTRCRSFSGAAGNCVVHYLNGDQVSVPHDAPRRYARCVGIFSGTVNVVASPCCRQLSPSLP